MPWEFFNDDDAPGAERGNLARQLCVPGGGREDALARLGGRGGAGEFTQVDRESGCRTRTPIIRPDSWSTSLNVRRSMSWPVPVSSDSTYSSNGGMTSS